MKKKLKQKLNKKLPAKSKKIADRVSKALIEQPKKEVGGFSNVNNSFNFEYFYKKYILMPISKVLKNRHRSLEPINITIDNGRYFIANNRRINTIKKNVGEPNPAQSESNGFLYNNINFLNTASKKLWLKDFKNFLTNFFIFLFLLGTLIQGDGLLNDISRIKLQAVYAKGKIEEAIVDTENYNIKTAKNRFYLAFESLYDINSKSSFLTNAATSIYGKFINFSVKDLDETIRCFDNITTASLKLANDLSQFKDKGYLYKIEEIKKTFEVINSNLNRASGKISNINTKYLPKKYKEDFILYKNKLDEIKKITNNIYLTSDTLSYILGRDGQKRLLFLFENTNEIRATGGFMGSYALLDFNKGKLTKYEVPGGGIYDLKAGFYKMLEPPMPFKTLVDKWNIQDSNWFFDFKKSSSKIIELFEPASRTSIDGIVAINSNLMSKIIDLTGNIELAKYDVIFTKDNIIDEIQKIINNVKQTKEPKVVIQDLFKIVSDKLMNEEKFDLGKIYETFNSAAESKQILAYFKNDKIEKNIIKLGIAGNIKTIKKTDDYLAVVETNIGGGKTSQFIEREINQNIQILSTGEIIKTLKIKKTYNKSNTIFDQVNKEFMRIYLPEGSSLISVYGFNDDVQLNDRIYVSEEKDKDLKNLNELYVKDINTNTIIYNDENRTIFGNFLYLEPGETKEVVVKYKLPFKINFEKSNKQSYILYVDKQSGLENTVYNINFNSGDVEVIYDNKKIENLNFILDKDKKIEFKINKK